MKKANSTIMYAWKIRTIMMTKYCPFLFGYIDTKKAPAAIILLHGTPFMIYLQAIVFRFLKMDDIILVIYLVVSLLVLKMVV